MYNVEYVWDKLRVCAVGRSYPPEFYSFMTDSKSRSNMEIIAQETEEDYQELIALLQSFDVEVIRTDIPNTFANNTLSNKVFASAMTPRDHCAMIGNTFYLNRTQTKWNTLRGPDWPVDPPNSDQAFAQLPKFVIDELADFGVNCAFECYDFDHSGLNPIERAVQQQGNQIVYDQKIDSAMIIRLGKDLIVGQWEYETKQQVQQRMNQLFPEHNCHVINSEGHLDGTVSILAPGLIVSDSSVEVGDYFKDWKVIKVGHTNNKLQSVPTDIEYWIGNAEETIIDINMLPIDQKNVVCINNNQIENELINLGINVHSVKMRHHLFWDGGVHCVTNDIDRHGNT